MNRACYIIMVLVAMSASVGLCQTSLQVPDMEDLVKLTNGTEIRGTILIVGSRRVIILVDEQEMDILPSEVEYIQKVRVPGELSSYLAENVDGMLRITCKGVAPAPEPSASGPKPKAGTRPPAAAGKKPAANPGKKPPAKKGANPAAKPGAKKPGRTGEKNTMPKEVQDLLKKYGGIEKIKELQKSGELDKLLKNTDLLQNKEIRKLIDQLSK